MRCGPRCRRCRRRSARIRRCGRRRASRPRREASASRIASAARAARDRPVEGGEHAVAGRLDERAALALDLAAASRARSVRSISSSPRRRAPRRDAVESTMSTKRTVARMRSTLPAGRLPVRNSSISSSITPRVAGEEEVSVALELDRPGPRDLVGDAPGSAPGESGGPPCARARGSGALTPGRSGRTSSDLYISPSVRSVDGLTPERSIRPQKSWSSGSSCATGREHREARRASPSLDHPGPGALEHARPAGPGGKSSPYAMRA